MSDWLLCNAKMNNQSPISWRAQFSHQYHGEHTFYYDEMITMSTGTHYPDSDTTSFCSYSLILCD